MARKRAHGASSGIDQGFTLIEVIVALMLMSIVLMAGGGFMIRSISTSSALSGRQGAVNVANQVMEQVRAVDPTLDSTGVSPLVYGRVKADVVAQWIVGATAGLDVSDTYTGSGSTTFDSDTYATAGTVTLPLQQTISSGNQAYTVATLIGTCVRADGATDCDKSALGDELYRVVVRVTWSPGAGRTCSGSPCAYVVTTLIDPTVNPVFNASRKPLAKPDTATTPSGVAVDIGITANDSGAFAPAGAVTIVTGPANGTYVVSNNIITYTPNAGFSGTNTFTYTVTDLTARTSNVTTVTITVTPVGVNDTATVVAGSTALTVAVLTNDNGTGLSLVSLTSPAIGTAAISGTGIKYTPPTTGSGTATVTYTAKDSSGQQYTATLTITVTAVAGPAAVPLGVASSYSVFSVASVANTGATTMTGSVGVSPTTTITGFPPGIAAGGKHANDSSAIAARAALTIAYVDASGRTGTSFTGDLGGKTFTPGVYKSSATTALTGTLTLNGGGDPNAVFIFQINGSLNPAASSSVVLTNGATAANVFWLVTGNAVIGATSSFSGTMLAAGTIAIGAGGQIHGRAFAQGAITLNTDTFS